MITYPHTYELRIGEATLTSFDIQAEILADEYTDGEWTVGKIEADALFEQFDGYGRPKFKTAMVEVPEGHLYDMILKDLLDNCTDDINEAWGHYLDEARDTARSNAAENKLAAAAV